ncbi:MAG: site-specific integrase [Firmicutes bacterium]|nr:site-specific integrase [Bacillota bacterium]
MASISVRQNRSGSMAYVVRVYAYRDETGRSHYLSKTFTPAPDMSKNRIDKSLQMIRAELEHKAEHPSALHSGLRFSDYSQFYLKKKELSVSAYTLQSYALALKKACCYLGSVPLERISTDRLESMTRRMLEEPSQYGKPYSASYIRYVQTIVRSCLSQAVRDGILEENPAESNRFQLLRPGQKDPVFLELDEAQQFVKAALAEPDPKIRSMVLLYLYTGIRMEELCGLEWRDIDFAAQQIHVRRASVYVRGEVVTKPTKTRSGTRVIRADAAVFEALQAYQSQKNGLPEQCVFTRSDGGPLIPGTTRIWLRRFEEKNGLQTVTPHKLRHTFATLQIAYGTDIRTVAGVMGHSSPMTTLTIYAHQVKEASEKASLAMSAMLTP